MNYTEMEAKVREATNNEPWGTSIPTIGHWYSTDSHARCLVHPDARNREWNIQLVRILAGALLLASLILIVNC